MASWTRENLFGGKGTVAIVDLLGAPQGPFTAALCVTLSGGGSVGRHRQEQYPELIIGLGGAGEVTVNGKPAGLGPGELVYLPLGSVLSIHNRGEEPLRYLIVKAQGAPP
jgi:quercetin dioxygenase-like cupin family protein